MSSRIAVQQVSVAYTMPGGEILPALGPVAFSIERGSFVCLVGPSGCGKSTLVRIMAGLQPPTQGHILLDGEYLSEPSSQVGMMFQDANLMPWRTVIENVALPLELAGVGRQERLERAAATLETLGLKEFAAVYPGELSGGMAQRTALGRVLIQRPEVLLLDEPFGALDAFTREQVSVDLLRIWAQQRQTVFMVTHNIQEAVLLADRVLVMSRRPGRIVADIAVTLERPRRLDDTYSDHFSAVARQVRAAIEA